MKCEIIYDNFSHFPVCNGRIYLLSLLIIHIVHKMNEKQKVKNKKITYTYERRKYHTLHYIYFWFKRSCNI
jgi:hypothetical protein